jgi:WD40 repeat protein
MASAAIGMDWTHWWCQLHELFPRWEPHSHWICDTTIRIWDAETGTTVGEPLKGHTGWVWGVAYSPNGRNIISGSEDGTIRIWDAETGAAVGKALEAHEKPVRSVAYSPNGRQIISGSMTGLFESGMPRKVLQSASP